MKGFFILFSVLLSGPSWSLVTLDKDEFDIEIAPQAKIYFDKDNKETIDSIRQKSFISPKGQKLHLSKAYWLRFEVESNRERHVNLMASTNTLATWKIYSIHGVTQSYYGNKGYRVKPSQVPYSSRPGLLLHLPKGKTIFYFKMVYVKKPMFNFSLQDEMKTKELNYKSLLFLIVTTTAMFFLGIYNLSLFYFLRDSNYLIYFCLTMSWCFGTLFSAGFFERLNIYPFGIYLTDVSSFFQTLTGIISILFARKFLNYKDYYPRRDKVLNVVVISLAVCSFISLPAVSPSYFALWSSLSNTIAVVILLLTAYSVTKLGYTPARYYLASVLAMSFGVLIWKLKEQQILPENLWTIYAAPIGCTLELLIMSLALAHRMRILQNESNEMTSKKIEGQKLRNLLRILFHDLANPVSIIRGHLGKMLRANPNDQGLIKSKKAVNVVMEILQKVKKMESANHSRILLEIQPVNIHEVFQEIEMLHSDKLEEKNIHLHIDMQIDDGANILAEKTIFVNEVLSNLVSNSIKFSNSGSTITLRSSWSQNSICIDVIDQGIGMKEEMVNELFNPNAKISRPGTNQEKGTGFGMGLVETFVKEFGGRVQVVSKSVEIYPEDHGTKISLYFMAEKGSLRLVS